ncbi:MAG: MFS transporter [Limnochordaceae bacterium]|nr:MFS transporter [Limnochordaceae bacterium]
MRRRAEVPGCGGRGRQRQRRARAVSLDREAPGRALAALGLIAVGVALIWMAYSQWQAVISVYMRELGYPLSSYGMLWTLNGLIIVFAQPLIVGVVRRWLKSLPSQMIAGTSLFAAAFLLVWQVPRYEGFVAGMAILTLGEMLVLPALPAAVAEIAPAHRAGLFQGVMGGAVQAGRMLGPVGGGAMYDRWSPPGVLAAAAGACVVAATAFIGYRATWRGRPSPSATGGAAVAGEPPNR